MKAKIITTRHAQNAQLNFVAPPCTALDYEALPQLARETLETIVREQRILAPTRVAAGSPLGQPAACFVSIKT